MSPSSRARAAMMNSGRIMYFIDGENLVFRYQALLETGLTPDSRVAHERDAYVWSTNIWLPGNHRVIRAYYYTSVTGDDTKVNRVTHAIKQLGLLLSVPEGNARTLYPVVFKKPRKSAKSKGVDIQMTVDILTHVYQDNLDTVCLFSGDGDYSPVLNEAIRSGKHVYVAAFSEGLSPALRQMADEVIDLDSVFFDLAVRT